MKIVRNIHDTPRTAPHLGRFQANEEREVEDDVALMICRCKNFEIVSEGEKKEQPEQPDATEPENIKEEDLETESDD